MSNPPLWLRGPIPDIHADLQGTAHGLLEALEEIKHAIESLPSDKLWLKPYGAASVGFHLQHLAGATDRLFTYARGDALTDIQRTALIAEQAAGTNGGEKSIEQLMNDLERVIDLAIEQLRSTDPSGLHEPRYIGGKKLPSTVTGLLEHAGQHASRHGGQVVTTVKVVMAISG